MVHWVINSSLMFKIYKEAANQNMTKVLQKCHTEKVKGADHLV